MSQSSTHIPRTAKATSKTLAVSGLAALSLAGQAAWLDGVAVAKNLPAVEPAISCERVGR